MSKPKVISVAKQKGSGGKSSTVYNLRIGSAMTGKKILPLDVDPPRRPHQDAMPTQVHDLPQIFSKRYRVSDKASDLIFCGVIFLDMLIIIV